MKRRTLSTLVSHPIGLVIVLGTLIGVTELLIMFAHDIFVPAIATETAWDYIDATLLIAILSPAFYLLVFRKLQTDLTERKQAQYALQESARQTQAILDNAIDGIITIDSRGTVDSFNRSAERIFGYPADEVIGQNVSILMPEPHRTSSALAGS
jgi:PAS domain-containing protein